MAKGGGIPKFKINKWNFADFGRLKQRVKLSLALAIAEHKKAKKIIITNNRLAILNGWTDVLSL